MLIYSFNKRVRKGAGQQVRLTVSQHQPSYWAANCTASTHFLGGFAGLWTNRIGPGAAVLGCAKTCPEELPHAPPLHSPHARIPIPRCCYALIPRKAAVERQTAAWERARIRQCISPRVCLNITHFYWGTVDKNKRLFQAKTLCSLTKLQYRFTVSKYLFPENRVVFISFCFWNKVHINHLMSTHLMSLLNELLFNCFGFPALHLTVLVRAHCDYKPCGLQQISDALTALYLPGTEHS